MAKKLRIGILFGGKSAEHEISLLSAKNVVAALDPNKYEVVLVGIDKNGEWHLRDAEKFLLNAENPRLVQLNKSMANVALVPKENGLPLVSLSGNPLNEPLDVVFPILHGTYGEDGTVQGLLKLSNVPFVGAGVLGSAIGMDKDVMKRLLRDAKINTAKFLTFHTAKIDYDHVVKKLGLPFFIKPANLGSSVGISKVKDRTQFQEAVDLAFSYDRKILIEEFIEGKEIECSILGNEHPIVSLPGEAIPLVHEFYSYEAKYYENGVDFKFPADLDKKTIGKIQKMAVKAYKVLCCEGMARVDMFLKANGKVYVNELNTIPGFTSTSAFPKLWAASGVSYTEILDKLIALALERHEKERALKVHYTPKI